MSFTSLCFIFDDIASSEMGINLVKVEQSGFFPVPVAGSKSMSLEKVPYRDTAYYYKTDLEHIKFDITIVPIDGIWSEDLKYNVFKWLGAREPKMFQTTDYLGKMIPCICTNAIDIMSVSTGTGYVNLEFEAVTPYWYTPVQISTFDLSDVTSPAIIEIENKSNIQNVKFNDFYYYPEMWIDLKDTETGVTLTNLSDGGRVFQFTGLTALEELYVNNDLRQIISSTENNRLNKLYNHQWFRLVYGKNQILVNNKCVLQFKCQFPIYV